MALEYGHPESSYSRALSLLQQASNALHFMDIGSLGPEEQKHILDLSKDLRTKCSEAMLKIAPAYEAGIEPEFIEPYQSDPEVA